jgi:hypothetical protein
MPKREVHEVYIAEFPCELHCSIEVDLTDHHSRFGRMQMRGVAGREHAARHAKLAADKCTNLCGTVCTCPEIR